jgi:hypothetical protein
VVYLSVEIARRLTIMADTEWIPDGVDIETLRTQERELRTRLEKIRGILQALSGKKGGRRGTTSENGSTRLSQIIQVLQQSETPLSVRDIYDKLCALDPSLKWTDPAPVFRSFIRRIPDDAAEKVVLIERGLYGIRGRHQPSTEAAGPSQSPLHPQQRLHRGAITSAVVDILREAHRPLAAGEIVSRLQSRGITQRARDPKGSLGVLMRRSPLFTSAGNGKFRLAEAAEARGHRDAS